METGLKYEMKQDNGEWLDVSPLVDSRNTSIERNICTTEFKSAIDSASFTLKAPPLFLGIRSKVVDMIMSALSTIDSHIYVKISHADKNELFVGVLSLDDISLTTKRLPENLSISCRDLSTVSLDEVPSRFIVLENKKVSEIIRILVAEAGYLIGSINIEEKDDVVLRAFVASPEESETYRDYIDTLLFEMGGYVLDCDNTGLMNVIRIPFNIDTSDARKIDNYMVDKGVESSTTTLEYDGIRLQWSTLSETAKEDPQVVYTDNIKRNVESDGTYTGFIIEPQAFWPEDGNMTASYQEYKAEFLDREYNTHQTKNHNRDLSLLLVQNVRASINAWDENGHQLDPSVAFDYPIVPELEMPSNPTFYPTKAWYLLRNKTEKNVNLTSFSLSGDCVYRNRINMLQLPAVSRKAEDYESIYIYTEERAKNFANFLFNMRQNSRTIHKWNELGSVNLGEIVKIAHKKTEIGQAAFIVQTKISFIGPLLKTSCIGVSIGKYNEYPFSRWGDENGITNSPVYNITDFYLSSNKPSGITVDTPGWTTNSTIAEEGSGKFLWKYTKTQYANGKIRNSSPVVIGVKGTEGITISEVITEYALSKDRNTPPVSGWQESWPENWRGYVIWCRDKITYSDGSTETIGTRIATGEDGSSYSVDIISDNGDLFRPGQVETTLRCIVFENTDDITDSIDAVNFNWKRNTGNKEEDERWNTSSKAIGKKSISITSEDCIGRTVFFCEVDL